MKVIGLTGGIGSGKSTVAALLREHGAVVVDADTVVRELQQPGQPVFEAIVDRFGPAVVADDGTLDRATLGDLVFDDPEALADLNRLTHPPVRAEMLAQIAGQADVDGAVVVVDIPLLAESDRWLPLDGVVVVEAPGHIVVARLAESRGLSRDQVAARAARQASPAQRRAIADRVLDNAGTLEDLQAQVVEVWRWIETLPG